MTVIFFNLRRPILLLLCGLILAAGGRSAAQSLQASPDADLVKSALGSSQNWLAEIDSGKYDESYNEGCLAFHNKVSRDQWDTILKALRPPLGAVVSRKVASYVYKPDGYEGLEGECFVIRYNTSFSKVPTNLELVVLKKEDGQWRGAGYNAQPQGSATDTDLPPPADAHTEVNQEPVK